MTQTLHTRTGLPEDLHLLVKDLPRETWPDHPNFAQSVQNWMGAHSMFRRLADITRADTEAFLDGSEAAETYAARLSNFGYLLSANLHGHHTWEDRSFFPELEAADPRFAHGLEMLETDHEALDALLDRFERRGNRIVTLAQLDPEQLKDEAGAMAEISADMERFLERHLTDEEDLVVPIILKHKLR